ncbi:MAG: type II toxin-antitoxin system VapC family toxin [Verrucomicrobiota bacterium]
MKTMTTREFFHTPRLAKVLRPGESITVTDNGTASFTITKAGQRPSRTRADLEEEAREICPEDGPKANFTAMLKEAKRKTPMMIYPDTSFLVALKIRRDTFHAVALDFYEPHQDEVWLWSPWHRVELLNAVRQLTRHPEARRRLRLAEAKALIHRLETEVRLGYFTHLEVDWRDVLRTANEISIACAFELPCPAADLLHVACAKELVADVFLSFDDEQLALAKASGLKILQPPTRNRSAGLRRARRTADSLTSSAVRPSLSPIPLAFGRTAPSHSGRFPGR